MIKVCFISWHFRNPSVFLDNILKMTPGKSGKWKDMEAVLDPNKADFCAIFDGSNVETPPERTIYFGQHPTCVPAFSKWENKKALAKLPLDKFLNPGEWWITHDYDTLARMDKPTKNKELVCVFTAHTHMELYRKRISFMEAFCPAYPTIDLFGRPKANFDSNLTLKQYYKGILGETKPQNVNGDHMHGKEGIVDYKYSLEFDVGPTIHYFSERFYDALLLWVMPFYYGSSNVHDYIPSEAFRYIDLDNMPKVDDVIAFMKNNVIDYNAISQARDLLLNKYQTWPYVYDVVTNIDKYKSE